MLLAFKVTLVGLSVPDAPPAHFTKAHPALAEAVSSIVEPSLYPSADPEIRFFETEPNPSFISVNSNLSFSINVAVTFLALSNVISTGFVLPIRAPDHSLNSQPSSEIAVNSTTVPPL